MHLKAMPEALRVPASNDVDASIATARECLRTAVACAKSAEARAKRVRERKVS